MDIIQKKIDFFMSKKILVMNSMTGVTICIFQKTQRLLSLRVFLFMSEREEIKV